MDLPAIIIISSNYQFDYNWLSRNRWLIYEIRDRILHSLKQIKNISKTINNERIKRLGKFTNGIANNIGKSIVAVFTKVLKISFIVYTISYGINHKREIKSRFETVKQYNLTVLMKKVEKNKS